MPCYNGDTNSVSCGSLPSCVFTSAGTCPDKTLSVSQCLGSRSGRRLTVMNVMVGPVFIPKSV